MSTPTPPTVPTRNDESRGRLADLLLAAGAYAQRACDDGYPRLSLRTAVNHAARLFVCDPRPALGALADYLAPGWRDNAHVVGRPGEVVDAWQKFADRPLDVPGVLALAAFHTSTVGGGAP